MMLGLCQDMYMMLGLCQDMFVDHVCSRHVDVCIVMFMLVSCLC